MILDQLMEEQLSEAFVRVKSILIDVKKSVQSVPVSNRNLFLPVISDILSEISEVVSSVQQADDVSINYSDSDSDTQGSQAILSYVRTYSQSNCFCDVTQLLIGLWKISDKKFSFISWS